MSERADDGWRRGVRVAVSGSAAPNAVKEFYRRLTPINADLADAMDGLDQDT